MMGVQLILGQGGVLRSLHHIPSQGVGKLSVKLLHHEDQSLLTREMFAYVLDAPAVMKDLRKLLTPERK